MPGPNDSDDTGEHSGADEYDVVRAMIQHENILRDQRLGWMLALNGFLFAALGFAWSDTDSATSLVLVVGLVGLAASASSGVAMYASELAIRRLREWPEQHLGQRGGGGGTRGGPRAPLVGLTSRELRQAGRVGRWMPLLYPWRILPWCLGAAWLAVVVVSLAS